MTRMFSLVSFVSFVSFGLHLCFVPSVVVVAQTRPGPVIVVDTAKGTFEIETYPADAPKTVAHVIELVNRGFYDGQRIHRALPGFLVQFGDPRSADTAQAAEWGRGVEASSGTPIGVAEINRKRLHTKGAVAMAHMGIPSQADSQMYIALAPRPDLDGKYAVFGRVITGEDVPGRLERGDLIRKVSLKPPL
jgi:peptidyl-prolyl cis-trans isomerase B (cyclophilin B)